MEDKCKKNLQFNLFIFLLFGLSLALGPCPLPLGLPKAVLVCLATERPLSAEEILQRELLLPLEVPLLYVLLVLLKQCLALRNWCISIPTM